MATLAPATRDKLKTVSTATLTTSVLLDLTAAFGGTVYNPTINSDFTLTWTATGDPEVALLADFDPNVRVRMEAARDISASDYIAMIRERSRLVRAMDARLADLDGLVLPTVPTVAPTFAEVSVSPEAFAATFASPFFFLALFEKGTD